MLWREVKDMRLKCISQPKYLSEAVKENTGKTPKELINDVLVLESKVLLGSTDKTISEIAHHLQFQDQAHFSHFIRQQTGRTPTELRKKS